MHFLTIEILSSVDFDYIVCYFADLVSRPPTAPARQRRRTDPKWKYNLTHPKFCQLTYKLLLPPTRSSAVRHVHAIDTVTRERGVNTHQTSKFKMHETPPCRSINAHGNYTCKLLNGWTHMIIAGSKANAGTTKFLWINFRTYYRGEIRTFRI